MASSQIDSHREEPLKVVFFGLYTPLQGTVTIGKALSLLSGAPIEVTMIGDGQDRPAAMAAAHACPTIQWLDWVPGDALPSIVAAHDVCLGIFGTTPKALRVVPNKVFQGAAAGCVVVTSDTVPQRQMLGDTGSSSHRATPMRWLRCCAGLRSIASPLDSQAGR